VIFLKKFFLLAILLLNIIIIPQTINILWSYNENSVFVIDDLTKKAIVGYMEISSSPGFYMYILPTTNNSKVTVTNVWIGKKSISMNPNYPTKIGYKIFIWGYGIVSGDLILQFNYPDFDLSLNTINVTLDFNFIPMLSLIDF
jgi:hypothetical protein